jgi:hypothetical protein
MVLNENHRGKYTVLTSEKHPGKGKRTIAPGSAISFSKVPGWTGRDDCSKSYMNPGGQRRRDIAKEDLHGRNSTKKP